MVDALPVAGDVTFDARVGVRKPILDAYGSAADEPSRFLEGARRRPDAKLGYQVFAIYHLVVRGLTGLIAGAHLLNHCYVVQAYSVMWPSLDACYLLELFARDASEASLWVTTEEGHKHFMPGQVRERLEQDATTPCIVISASPARTHASLPLGSAVA